MPQSPGKRDWNRSNGSSPVLRPWWLAIQYTCQARVTLWLWKQALREMNEWSLQQRLHSSKTLLTWLMPCSFSILVELSYSCSESHHAVSGLFIAWYIIPQSLAFSKKVSTAAFDAYTFKLHRKFKTAFVFPWFPSV